MKTIVCENPGQFVMTDTAKHMQHRGMRSFESDELAFAVRICMPIAADSHFSTIHGF